VNPLRIFLLGTPLVQQGENQIHINRRLQRVLLYYLAARGEPVSRTELMVLFWPERNESTARSYLRDSLNKLRSELPDPTVLVATREVVYLDTQWVDVDVSQFQRIIHQSEAQLRQFTRGPLPAYLVQALTEAVQLWRSPHFMAGVDLPKEAELEEWVLVTGQKLLQARETLIRRLAEHYRVCGDLETALQWLYIAVETNDLNEEAHHQIIDLLIQAGRRSEAIQHFNFLRNLYRHEYGEDLPRSLQLIAGKLQVPDSMLPIPETSFWPVALTMQVPLVGRQAWLNLLNMTFERGGIVLVTGEAGIGKTRLVKEFFHRLSPTPQLVLAQAHPLEQNLPFQPLITGLRQLLSQSGWEQVPEKWRRRLAQLLPEMTVLPAGGDEFQPGDVLQERGQIFEAIYWLLISLSRDQQVLIFLDDAQWADEATLACLSYLGVKLFFRNYGCLVLAARHGERNNYLETFIHSHQRLTGFYEVKLELLNSTETSELTHYVLGKQPAAALVDQLVQDTGGNPLFLLETLRLLLSTPGNIQGAAGMSLPLAGSITALVRERLRSITPHVRQVLETAATAGSQFDINTIELACPLTQEEIARSLDELENLDFIKPVPGLPEGTLSYSFIHEKIRASLLLDISPARRRLLRLRLAQAIESQSGSRVNQKAAVIASLYEAAGEPHLAFTWWQQAAAYARQLFSLSEAETAYQKAEHLLHALGSNASDQEIKQLYTAWGKMAYETPRVDVKTRIYSTLLHIGETRRSPLLIGTAHNHLATACWLSNQMDAGLKHSEQALVLLAQTGDVQELAEAYNQYGSLLISINQFDKAVEMLGQVLAIQKEHPDLDLSETGFFALHRIGRAWLMMGWPNKATQYSEQAFKEFPTVTHPFAVSSVLAVLLVANIFKGDYSLAWDHSERAIQLVEKFQNWRYLAYFYLGKSQVNFERGWLDEGSQDLAHVLDLIRDQPGVEDIQAAVCRNMADMYVMLGNTQIGQNWLEKGLVGDPNSFYYLDNLWRVGQIAGITGNFEQGKAILEAALQASQAQQLGIVWVPVQLALINLALVDGSEIENVDGSLEQLTQEMDQRGYGILVLTARWLSAECAYQKGQFENAMDRASRVIETSAAMGYPWMMIRCYHLLDRAHFLHTGAHHPTAYQAVTAVLEQIGEHATQADLSISFEVHKQTALAGMR
jgi:predicted ATPase/DNA-binding SARP family transcriptional activator